MSAALNLDRAAPEKAPDGLGRNRRRFGTANSFEAGEVVVKILALGRQDDDAGIVRAAQRSSSSMGAILSSLINDFSTATSIITSSVAPTGLHELRDDILSRAADMAITLLTDHDPEKGWTDEDFNQLRVFCGMDTVAAEYVRLYGELKQRP
jgi:hypothetical protein